MSAFHIADTRLSTSQPRQKLGFLCSELLVGEDPLFMQLREFSDLVDDHVRRIPAWASVQVFLTATKSWKSSAGKSGGLSLIGLACG